MSEVDGKPTLGLSFGGKGGRFLSLPRTMVWGLWGRAEMDLGDDRQELEGGTRLRSPTSCRCWGSCSCSKGPVIPMTAMSLTAGGILGLVGLGKILEGAVGGEVGAPL